MKAIFVLWEIFTGLLALSSFSSASDSGDWEYFWTWMIIFLIPPTLWVVLFLLALTPSGQAEAERLRQKTEKAYALRHPTPPKSVFEQSKNRSDQPPAPGISSVTYPSMNKPGKLLHPTPENFEEYCTDWCKYLGYRDAVKTQNSRDGGIDIKASKMIAQVKFQVSPVGVRPIRELNGVRKAGQEVLFFALNGFTPEARREAAEMNITLIRVSPLEGQIDILA